MTAFEAVGPHWAMKPANRQALERSFVLSLPNRVVCQLISPIEQVDGYWRAAIPTQASRGFADQSSECLRLDGGSPPRRQLVPIVKAPNMGCRNLIPMDLSFSHHSAV